jgi:tetratricopeptide (TPR) repeat protein
MTGYTARQAAQLLSLSPAQLRAYVRSGFLAPRRGARGEYLFSFQDLVLLRTAKGLVEAKIPSRRVKRALEHLRRQLPSERPLSGVNILAKGDRIVVQDGEAMWQPESGQALFNFEVAELAEKVAPIARRAHAEAQLVQEDMRAADWYALGVELETGAPLEARDAYRRALELDPKNTDARLNLGRLLHVSGKLQAAEAHYRIAIEERPGDAVCAYNLGVVLADQQRYDEAIAAYLLAISWDEDCADAYFNLSHVYEALGKKALALRYLKAYRDRTEHDR